MAHVSELDDESRARLGPTPPAFVATKWEPPQGWLVMELHVTGSRTKAMLALCPVCRLGSAIVAKAVASVVDGPLAQGA